MASEKCHTTCRARTASGIGLMVFFFLASSFCIGTVISAIGSQTKGGIPMFLTLSSPAFAHNNQIPLLYTCDGRDISPPLSWKSVPPGTKSLALIVDDPDAPDPKAPKMTWVHWVIYNIPPEAGELGEDASYGGLPAGTLDGINDWKRTGYGGPCPPIGRHRYFFKLYALDTRLPDLNQPSKEKLLQAMAGHILRQAELIGTFER